MMMDIRKASANLCLYIWDRQYGEGVGWKTINNVALRKATFGIFVLTCIIGLIGNAIVIFITGFLMKDHKSKIWFLNMAIADFIFLLCLPFKASAVLQDHWPYGIHLCKLYNFLSTYNMYTSIFIMTALNIDRALSVAKPFWHHKVFTHGVCYKVCGFIWIVMALCSLPAFFISYEEKRGNRTICLLMDFKKQDNNSTVSRDLLSFAVDSFLLTYYNRSNGDHETFIRFPDLREQCLTSACCANEETVEIWHNMIFTMLCFTISVVLIGYFIPLCTILISNAVIIHQVWKSQNAIPSNLYKVTISVVLVYFITWTPLVSLYVITLVALSNVNISLFINVIIFQNLFCSIAYTNNCLNPIIYVLVGKQARGTLSDSMKRLSLTSSKGSSKENK